MMKVNLLFAEQDFDPKRQPVSHASMLIQDLELGVVFDAMADGDTFLRDVSARVILANCALDIPTMTYRQDILRDCLANPGVLRAVYALALEAMEAKKKSYWISSSSHPSSILYASTELLRAFVNVLEKLRQIAEQHVHRVKSKGMTRFLSMLRVECSSDYLASVRMRLREAKFQDGVFLSAGLGSGNEGIDYVVREPSIGKRSWLKRLLRKRSSPFTYRVADRDEAGARALGALRDRGINLIANALAQSSDHMLSFFDALRVELAFYVGCVNLHERLRSCDMQMSFPHIGDRQRSQRFAELYDPSLALSVHHRVVGNTLSFDRIELIVITGANQGGKSTFLRALGLAQLMMQCGMFVASESFSGTPCAAVFTHYKREEDVGATKGKLDEELERASAIAESITPGSLLLCNESFAATNEQEGSEIARQIVSALVGSGIRVCFVTHLYDFALRPLKGGDGSEVMFLRAERLHDGTRTFRVVEGEPLETSHGEDLYREIFSDDKQRAFERTETCVD